MGDRELRTVHHSRTTVFVRGLIFGTMNAGVAGALVGTCILPIVGTVYGYFLGAVFGFAIGVPCSLTLALKAPRLADRDAAAGTGALTGMAWSVVGVVGFSVAGYGEFFGRRPIWVVIAAVVVAVCGAVVGAVVAPRATFARDDVAQRTETNPLVAGPSSSRSAQTTASGVRR